MDINLKCFNLNIFFAVGDNAVEIMAGNDEGINAWMTVNFLLGSLGGTGKCCECD